MTFFMERILPIVGLALSIISASASQPTSKFPIDSTSMWKIDHIRNGVSDEVKHISGDEIYSYFINGDTLIGEHTYYKVFKTGVSYLDEPFYYENVYAGALRDDDNKFFFVEKKKSEEVLLYDFTSKVGDTIQVPYKGAFEEKVVSSVDTLPDGRKMIHFNPKDGIIGCGDQYIIEGIGGSGGLLEGPVCNHFWTYDNHLVCFTQNNLLLYHDNNFEFNCGLVKKPVHDAFLDSTCVWRVDKQSENDFRANFEKINYFINGDTLIGENTYLKLFKDGFQLLIDRDGNFTSGINHGVYTGAIRESDNRFYFVAKGFLTETLLYDFNLKAGDVIEGFVNSGKTIVSVDSVIDGRKNFLLTEDYWQNFIIEGIGSDKGLLESSDENSRLICFMKNDVPVFHNSTGAECMLSYHDYDFYDCEKLTLITENPTDKDDIKLLARVCFQVASPDPIYPDFESRAMTRDENSINIKLNYTYDDQNMLQSEQIIVPMFDTINIGKLPAGDYSAEVNVNNFHINSEEPYTEEYYKNMYLSFTVSSSVDVIEPSEKDLIRIFPSVTSEYVYIEGKTSKADIQSINVYNIAGLKVAPSTIVQLGSDARFKLNVGNLVKGMYLIVVQSGDSEITQKISIY